MYKSRLVWGDIIFLIGFVPAFMLLNGLGADDSLSAASAVGLFIFFVLFPFMGLGGLMASSAVFGLTSIEKISNSNLNNVFGRIFIILGWLILITMLLVLGFVIYGFLLHYTT